MFDDFDMNTSLDLERSQGFGPSSTTLRSLGDGQQPVEIPGPRSRDAGRASVELDSSPPRRRKRAQRGPPDLKTLACRFLREPRRRNDREKAAIVAVPY